MTTTATCAPPRPLSRRPAFVPPPGAWDCHCHVFGPADPFPYAEGRPYTPPDVPAEQLLALHDALGFDHAVLVQAAAHGTDHTAMRDAMRRSGGRYRGVMLADDPDALAAELPALTAEGMRGVRFNYAKHLGQAPDPGRVREIAGLIAPFGWHLVLFAGPPDFATVEACLDFGLPVVLDHLGRLPGANGTNHPDVDRLLGLLDSPALHVKVSGIDRSSATGEPWADAMPIARRLLDAAPGRVLWGTDYPHPNHTAVPDDAGLVDAIPLIAPDPAQRQVLLVDTPLRLYR